MHDPYDDDDDNYDDDHYNYDYNDQYDPYKFYFTFNLDQNTSLSDWVKKMINEIFENPADQNFKITNIHGFPSYVFPVNSWNPNTENNKKFQYLGSNYAGEVIWKSNYWVIDPINQEYKAHLQSNAGYFVQQPNYYKGLFDILN